MRFRNTTYKAAQLPDNHSNVRRSYNIRQYHRRNNGIRPHSKNLARLNPLR